MLNMFVLKTAQAGVVNFNFSTTGSRPYYETLTIKQLTLMRN